MKWNHMKCNKMKLNEILGFHFMKGMKREVKEWNEIKLNEKKGKERKNEIKLKDILGFLFLSCLSFWAKEELLYHRTKAQAYVPNASYTKNRDFHKNVCAFTYFIKLEWLKTNTKKPSECLMSKQKR